MKSPSEDLAVYLILQDMRHFQFISRLEAVGFDTETQVLDLATVVAGLMGLRREDITDDWCDAYVNFLHLATAQPMEGAGEALRPLAHNATGRCCGWAGQRADASSSSSKTILR